MTSLHLGAELGGIIGRWMKRIWWRKDGRALNLRASLIVGLPVRGDVLLSKIRVRPHECNQPCMRWGSYTLALCEASPISIRDKSALCAAQRI